MITGIRSAIICDDVITTERGMSYVGLYGDTLGVESRPGFLYVWLALQLELDRKGVVGMVTIQAGDFRHQTPFDTPAGVAVTAVCFPVMIPVTGEGPLTVTVRSGDRGKAFKIRWTLAFTHDAQQLDAVAADALARSCAEGNAIVARGLASQVQARH